MNPAGQARTGLPVAIVPAALLRYFRPAHGSSVSRIGIGRPQRSNSGEAGKHHAVDAGGAQARYRANQASVRSQARLAAASS